jgi:SET domain-containing protein
MARKRARSGAPKPYCVGRSRTGLGLFAATPIKKGAFIIAYRGRRITNAQAEKLEARGSRYMFEINSRWTIDGSSRRNIARYANHSCRPNAESDVVKGGVILRAIKNIKPGDEITYDYGPEYFEIFLEPAGCKCDKCMEKRRKQRRERRLRSKRKARR